MLFSVLAFAEGHHDQSPADPLKLKKLTESVYVLYGRGGTSALNCLIKNTTPKF